jgi:translation initiation factor IF-3
MASAIVTASATAVAAPRAALGSARRGGVVSAAIAPPRAGGFSSASAFFGASLSRSGGLGLGVDTGRRLGVVVTARGRGRGRRGGRVPMDRGPARNEDIDLPEVRVIDEATKEVLGIMSSDEALDIAEEQGLDLVLMSPEADPPVCRIMNYSKYKYEQEKKQRETRKRAAATRVEVKELKMRYNIDVHDYGVRLKAAKKFLDGGDRVKVICQFRGRENEFRDLGRDMFMRFCDDVGEDIGVREGNPTMEGNRMVMLIAPTKEKSANSVSTRQDRNQRKKDKAARNKAAAEEEDEDEEYEDEDDQELDESYEEEEEEVVLTSK